MPHFIVMEGFDGVGKSTIAHWMEQEYKLHYLKSPSGIFSRARDAFDQVDSDLNDRIAFYTGDCINLSFKVGNLLQDNKSVILDRYYYTTLAYHEHLMPESVKTVSKVCESLVQPDVLLYLQTDYKTIQDRIAGRALLANDILFMDEDKYSIVSHSYHYLLQNKAHIIDNNGQLEDTKNQIRIFMNALDYT